MPSVTVCDVSMCFWNARGLISELLDVLRLMDVLKIAVFAIMETRVFGGDLSWGKYPTLGTGP